MDPVDPNERTPGMCCLGDPQVVNMSPVGLARFCSLRSWLSQLSYDDANGDGVSQRETLREAVGICTDWLIRHNSPSLQ